MNSSWRKKAFLKAAAKGSFLLTKLTLNMVNDDIGCMLTALYGAAAKNHKKIAELLINAGTPPDRYDVIGYTHLHIAVLNGNLGLVMLLLNKGVDANQGSRGRLDTALHLLAGGRTKGLSPQYRLDATELLLKHGAPVNQTNAEGNTALFNAIWHVYRGLGSTNIPIIKALIDAGADALQENKYGETALSWARLNGVDEVLGMLAEAEDKAKLQGAIATNELLGTQSTERRFNPFSARGRCYSASI